MVYDYLIDLDLSKPCSHVALQKLKDVFSGCFVEKFETVDFERSIRCVLHLFVPLTVPQLANILGVPWSCISLCRDVYTEIKFLNFN